AASAGPAGPATPATPHLPHPPPVRSERTGGIAPPSAKVAAGILTAALLCFTVGAWALTRI
ncbi:serine/threonine protein kinase, partial [Streptomyces sp. SID7760]|nr:serine/threonine protein kinase [Streptomyces sp. SID7760]